MAVEKRKKQPQPSSEASRELREAKERELARQADELLRKAHGTYNRVYGAYKSTPEVCAEAGWQAYETAIAMGNKELADQMIQALASEPKLAKTARAKKAVELAK